MVISLIPSPLQLIKRRAGERGKIADIRNIITDRGKEKTVHWKLNMIY